MVTSNISGRRRRLSPSEGKLIRLADVPRLRFLPRRRGRRGNLAVSTVIRWALDKKRRTRLRVTRVGGTWCTTSAWLRDFFDRQAQEELGELQPMSAEASQQRAEEQLQQLGAMQGKKGGPALTADHRAPED